MDKVYSPLVYQLKRMSPSDRVKYVREHENELEALTEYELQLVGTLLCQATDPDTKKEYPIFREKGLNKASPQEVFEQNVTKLGVEQAQAVALEAKSKD